MRDWRSPGAKVRALANQSVRTTLQAFGRFAPVSNAEKAVRPADAVRFFGEKPGAGGTLRWHDEHRYVYQKPRPRFEKVRDVVYSPEGKAWRNGRLEERYSVAPLGVQALLRTPPAHPSKRLRRATIVEADFVYSYGDWVHSFLGPLLAAGDILPPLLLPVHLARKSYVVRDLDTAAISYEICSEWTHIEELLAIRKPHPVLYWSPAEVQAFQACYCSERPSPEPGSALYLGRYGVNSETVHRDFPHVEIEAALAGHTVSPVRQENLTVLTAPALAGSADIVIGDHGSGMLNIMFWRPSVVIELYVNDWWVNNTLFVAAAMGIEKLCVISVEGLNAGEIRTKIEACLDAVGASLPGPA